MNDRTPRRDDGFSLIELLVVITVLGVLATVVVMAVGGVRDEAHEGACPAERRTIFIAAQAYLTETDAASLPAADATPDGYERTLVNANLLKSVSDWYDLDAAGDVAPSAESPCT